MRDLSSLFPLVEQRIQWPAPGITRLQTEPVPVLACPLATPMLGPDPPRRHPTMEIENEGASWPFRTPRDLQPGSWSALLRNRTLFRSKVLYPGQTIRDTILLPRGTCRFTLMASLPNERFATVCRLEVSLDDCAIGTLDVEQTGAYSLRWNSDTKTYRLKIRYAKPPPGTRGSPLRLEGLSLRCSSDLLLISPPKNSAGVGILHIRYRANPEPGATRLHLYDLNDIHRIKTDVQYDLNDAGIQANPYQIKRKLFSFGTAFNAIMAPPETEFIWRERIPRAARLEFGYGIKRGPRLDRDAPLTFEVRALSPAGNAKTLFRRELSFNDLQEHGIPFVEARVELDDLADQMTTLYFLCTQSREPSQQHPPRRPLGFWTSPIIFMRGETENRKNNVILISLDTLRADHLGCFGYGRDTSPELDDLARDSVLFRHAFSPSSWTLPVHISLLTSLQISRHRVFRYFSRLNPSIPTLADLLRQRGFVTAAITGGGFVKSKYGFSKGFDYYRDWGTGGQRGAEKLFQAASHWLNAHGDKPFFLFLHTYQIHNPYANAHPAGRIFLRPDHPWKTLDMIKHLRETKKTPAQITQSQWDNIVALYDGEIRYTDQAFVGPLVRRLKELGLYDNTSIILLSDHGEEFNDHGSYGHGHSLYNELIRVPLIVKLPKSRHAGKTIRKPVGLLDVMPSVLLQAGIDTSNYSLDGRPLDVFGSSSSGNRPLISEHYNQTGGTAPFAYASDHLAKTAIIDRDDKLIYDTTPSGNPEEGSGKAGHRAGTRIEFYRWREDLAERRNVYLRFQRRAKQLIARIEEHYRKQFRFLVKPGQTIPDKRDLDQLRALGYIN